MSNTSNQHEDLGYTPASPVKRTLAWIGLCYVLILLALTTYFYFTGKTLGNLAPLLTVPGMTGMGVLALVSWRSTGKPGKWPAILLAALCWLLALATLPAGLIGLLSNFPGSLDALAQLLSQILPGTDMVFVTGITTVGG